MRSAISSAKLPESKARGYKPGRFSFNVKEGSCPQCEGMGMVKIDMDFMEDAWVECPPLQRQALRSRNPLSLLQRQKHLRCAGDGSGRSRSGIFCQYPLHQAQARNAEAGGDGIHQAGTILHNTIRRRSAADQAGQRAGPSCHRKDPLYLRRTDHRPAFPRHQTSP